MSMADLSFDCNLPDIVVAKVFSLVVLEDSAFAGMLDHTSGYFRTFNHLRLVSKQFDRIFSSKFTILTLAQAGSTALEFASKWSSLVKCDLTFHERTREVDVRPLSQLPTLKDLRSSNTTADGIGCIPHLTRLRLKDAKAKCGDQCLFAPVLQELELSGTDLFGMREGVFGLTALCSLNVTKSKISAGVGARQFCVRYSTCLPASLSELRHVTQLSVTVESPILNLFPLAWVQSLIGLEKLCLTILSECTVNVGNTFANLRNLNCLSIKLTNAKSVLLVNVPWSRMAGLREILFSAPVLDLRANFLELADMERLKSLELFCDAFANALSASCFPELPSRNLKQNAGVKLCVGGAIMSNKFFKTGECEAPDQIKALFG